jgi:hypothetical protein
MKPAKRTGAWRCTVDAHKQCVPVLVVRKLAKRTDEWFNHFHVSANGAACMSSRMGLDTAMRRGA